MLKNLIKAGSLFAFLFVSTANAIYVYEANQPLYDLQTNSAGSTGLGSNDDSVSAAFNLGFTFTFYGNDFTQARMATNGCLHFNLTGSYCGDYTPDPLPQYTNTLFPFWTDLIKDNGSAMRAKAFDDYTIFGWYKMREYNRSGSDNSIEVWLYPNNTFEYRYGELDIKTHDVLIGEQGPTTSDIYTYLFFDECNTGTTNISGTCVNYDWNSNSNSYNTLLEDGGSLYGLGSGNALDCTNPLNNTACAGYNAAYLTQQCDLDGLYSTQCPNYWDDLFNYECSFDSQYSPACPGYLVETYETDYYEDEYYGYEDDYYGYEDDMYGDDPYANMEFTDEEWYEIDLEEFGQEQVEEWYGTEVSFDNEGLIVWEDTALESWDELDTQMDIYDYEQEQLYHEEFLIFEEYIEEPYEEYIVFEEYVEEPYEEYIAFDTYVEESYEEIYIIEDTYEELYVYEIEQEYEVIEVTEELFFHFEHEQLIEVFDEEPSEFLEFENIEELEEWYEEEELEEELEEIVEEVVEEAEEELEIEEEPIETETSVVENKEKRQEQLNVVAQTIQTASNSMSGTTSGTSVHSTATSAAAGSTGVVQSSTGGGTSMSNSPSISAQITSSAVQTQQILSMDVSTSGGPAGMSSVSTFVTNTTGGDQNTVIGNNVQDTAQATTNSSGTVASNEVSSVSTSTEVNTVNTSTETETMTSTSTETATVASTDTTSTTNEVMNTASQISTVSVQTQSVETQIDTAVAGVETNQTDDIVAQIVAQNVQIQQEEMEEQQTQTGEYADSSTLIAYMAYVPGFSVYRQTAIPDQTMWYQPKAIYGNVSISDNNSAFFGLYSKSLKGINELKQLQPNL